MMARHVYDIRSSHFSYRFIGDKKKQVPQDHEMI
jgi:hypothetical protein